MTKPLSIQDDPYDVGGKTVRLFSTDHLEQSNPYATKNAESLLERVNKYLDDVAGKDWPHENTFAIAKDLLEGPNDDLRKTKIRLFYMIREGNMFGLGAPWGVSEEANILWATAYHCLKKLGYEHPNDIPVDIVLPDKKTNTPQL